MGYLFLLFALIGGLGKGFLGKNISSEVNSFRDCIIMNMMRMFFCALIGMAFIAAGGNISSMRLSGYTFAACTISAVCMSAFCVCWMYAYKTEAYMFLSVFTMLSSVVTCILSFVILNEKIGAAQYIGMAFIALAVFIMSKYNKSVSGSLTPIGIAILVIGCMGSAGADFCQKLCRISTNMDSGVFNFYTYVLGFVILAVIFVFIPKSGFTNGVSFVGKRNTLICFAISASLYLNSFSKTVAAGYLSSAQIYPVLQGANLIASALFAAVLLKEKINRKSIAGMACSFAGLLIMNL